MRRRILITAIAKEKLSGGARLHHSGRGAFYRRRDDRIELLIAAARQSVPATFAKCRRALKMSAYRARAEVVGGRSEWRDLLKCMIRPFGARGFGRRGV